MLQFLFLFACLGSRENYTILKYHCCLQCFPSGLTKRVGIYTLELVAETAHRNETNCLRPLSR